jgi:hypothetical protein
MRDIYHWRGYHWRVMRVSPFGSTDQKWFKRAQYWANKWALYLGHVGD